MKKKVDQQGISFEETEKCEFAFLYGVATTGHRWDDDLASAGDWVNKHKYIGEAPWLVVPPDPQRWSERRYAPLSIPDLHRTFGKVEITRKGIKNFADQYGLLGQYAQLIDLRQSPAPVIVGESLSFWQDEIIHISRLLELWDLIKEDDIGGLNKFVVWGRDQTVSVVFKHFTRFPTEGGAMIASRHNVKARAEYDKGLINYWGYNSRKEPARYYVCEEINKRLRSHVSPRVSSFREGEIYMFPDNLLSAFYILFSLEVSGRQRPFFKCKQCSKYSPQNENGKPSRREFCDDSCRKQFNYHKSKNRHQAVLNAGSLEGKSRVSL
ncbi:MAG: hypothetical protein WKF74_16820 [Pyrinomonadaceae bacterium]